KPTAAHRWVKLRQNCRETNCAVKTEDRASWSVIESFLSGRCGAVFETELIQNRRRRMTLQTIRSPGVRGANWIRAGRPMTAQATFAHERRMRHRGRSAVPGALSTQGRRLACEEVLRLLQGFQFRRVLFDVALRAIAEHP